MQHNALTVILSAADPEALNRAARHLREGGLLVFPTETFYGLAADPRREAAVRRLSELKERPPGKPFPLLAGGVDQVRELVTIWPLRGGAGRLAARFWPGPLTLVLPAGPGLAAEVIGPGNSVAVRVSPHPAARGLARALGFAVVATSANPSGALPRAEPAEAWAAFRRHPEVWLLEGGIVPGGRPSTLVDARGAVPLLLRPGPIAIGDIEAAWAG